MALDPEVPEPERSFADMAISAIRDRRYHAARGWLAEAIDAQREARDARIVNVPVLRTLAAWERCPKRHASEGQHLIDCSEPPAIHVSTLPDPYDPDVADRLENRGPWRP